MSEATASSNGAHSSGDGPVLPDTYPYAPDFRHQILGLLLKEGWLRRHANLVKPEYFTYRVPGMEERGRVLESSLAEAILGHFDKHRALPSRADLGVLVPDFPEDTLDKIVEMSQNGLHVTFDEVRKFARDQAVAQRTVDMIRGLERGHDLEPLAKGVADALRVGEDLSDPGLELVADIDKYLSHTILAETVPTGWMHVDEILSGGLACKELGLIMAPPGTGKTMSLVNIGSAAADLLTQKNVIHITLEMSAEKVLQRYAARMAFSFWNPDKDDLDEYKAKVVKKANLMLRGRILVKEYPTRQATVGVVRSFIERKIDEGFNPGLIIVDYPDLLRPTTSRTERRHELTDIHEELRGVAVALNLPIWGATQSNRASLTQKIIDKDAVAEDIGKVNTADVIMSFCQTRDEHAIDKARFYMAKVRDGESKGQIELETRFKAAAIVSIGRYTEDEGQEAEPPEDESPAPPSITDKKQTSQVSLRRSG